MVLPPCQPQDREGILGLGWSTSPSTPASRGAGEAQGCQLSPLSKKELKEAPDPQPGAPLLTNELLQLFIGLFQFYMECDLLWVKGKVPTKQWQKRRITKTSDTSLSPPWITTFLPLSEAI